MLAVSPTPIRSIATATGPGQATIYASWQDYNNPQGTPCQSYLTDPDEEYISEGQETSENQAINIAPQLDFAEPPCENCTNNVVFPVLSVILTVKTPRVTSVTAAPAQAVKRVTQVLGNQDIFHFVTPKGSANSQVTLTAVITPNNQQVLNDISWEGATESATNPLEATVPKDMASKKVVKIKYKGNTIKELRVWVVWTTIVATTTHAIFHTVNAFNVGDPPTTGGYVDGGYNFTHTINPSQIITDTDKPDFCGNSDPTMCVKNMTDAPGGNHPVFTTDALSRGANQKWDSSRQIRIKIINPNNIASSDLSQLPFVNLSNYPTNDVEGNDDRGTNDEINRPYNNNFAALISSDKPNNAVAHRAGNNGNTFELRVHFREFTRLEIEGVWYRVSDFYLWKIHFKYLKVNGLWINDSSFIGLDNNNF